MSEKIISVLKRPIKDDEVLFRLKTALIVAGIPLLSFVVMLILLYIFLQTTLNTFMLVGFTSDTQLESIFFDYSLNSLWESLPLMILIFSLHIFLGLYLAKIFLRPFKAIGSYCHDIVEGRNSTYDPDFYSDLKLLTQFSEYFFNITQNALAHKEIKSMDIPKKFTGIHKPVFEKNFYFQFFSFIMMSSVIFSFLAFKIMTGIYEDVMAFAHKTLNFSPAVTNYLGQQGVLLEGLFWVVLIAHVLLNLITSVYFYSKVSSPAFGVFATMRSFLKGNSKARVHLVGFYYVRNQCRKLNKYLDFVERNCLK